MEHVTAIRWPKMAKVLKRFKPSKPNVWHKGIQIAVPLVLEVSLGSQSASGFSVGHEAMQATGEQKGGLSGLEQMPAKQEARGMNRSFSQHKQILFFTRQKKVGRMQACLRGKPPQK